MERCMHAVSLIFSVQVRNAAIRSAVVSAVSYLSRNTPPVNGNNGDRNILSRVSRSLTQLTFRISR